MFAVVVVNDDAVLVDVLMLLLAVILLLLFLVMMEALYLNYSKGLTLFFFFLFFFFFFFTAAISEAPNMRAQYVIHVHSPSWGSDEATENLDKAVRSTLMLADEKNIKYIAFPSIGSGR